MAGGEVFLNRVNRDNYHEQTHARQLPMMLEVGEACVVRLDLSAFDLDGTPGTPSLSEFKALVTAKLQNADRWSMLVVNRADHKGPDVPTDYYITFDPNGLIRRLDHEPVLGDPMKSLDRASQNFDPADEPGGYALPAELTPPLDETALSAEAITAEIDADLAQLLGGTALSEQ